MTGTETAQMVDAELRPGDDELRGRYASYRLRQATQLVRMLPREAIRPLYRRALAGAPPSEAAAQRDDGDPLALLVRYCETLLPLPPFEVWRDDLERHAAGHYADLEDSVHGPTADAPSTMEARPLDHGGSTWFARLRTFRDAGFWRAYIAFEERGSGRVYRTATVFCEEDAGSLRDRFLSFDSSALQAFLRSALP